MWIGSIALCGYAPCAPLPCTVMRKPSTENIIAPVLLYMYTPMGMRPAATW